MSKIEWTDRTWNPLAGCTVISPGCTHCYAMRMAHRLEAMGQEKYQGTTWKTDGGKILWTGRINLDEKALLEPLKWKKPQRVFVNSMSDLFHENVPFEYVDKVFAIMALTPHITYQVLTKRPERMAEFLVWKKRDWACLGPGCIIEKIFFRPWENVKAFENGFNQHFQFPLPNVWLGTTVENQKEADARIQNLLRCPAAVRFLSCEPLLGPVEFSNVTKRADAVSQLGKKALSGIHWVIAGGESGHQARPVHEKWIRSMRDQCQAAGVPFFFKQWGEWIPNGQQKADTQVQGVNIDLIIDKKTWSHRIGKKAAGRLLDGVEWNQFPEKPEGF